MKNNLEKILGFLAGKELKRMIIKMAKADSISVEEAASKFQLPEVQTLDDSGTFTIDGVKMTPAEYEADNPYRRLVTISTRK